MKRVVMLLTGLLLTTAAAQDLSGAILGAYGDAIGVSVNVEIPNYGLHGVVKLTSVRLTPAEARDVALPLFTALANGRDGVVSVSVHAGEPDSWDDYVLVFQKLADGTVSVYLDGSLFTP